MNHEAKEQAKPVGLTASTGFQIGVRRTFPATQQQVWSFLISREGLKLWLGDIPSLDLHAGFRYETKEGTIGELRVVKPYEQLRLTWKRIDWERPSTLQIRILPGKANRTTVSFHQEHLRDASAREQMKQRWEQVSAEIMDVIGSDK